MTKDYQPGVLTRKVMVEKKGNHGDTEGTELHGEKGIKITRMEGKRDNLNRREHGH